MFIVAERSEELVNATCDNNSQAIYDPLIFTLEPGFRREVFQVVGSSGTVTGDIQQSFKTVRFAETYQREKNKAAIHLLRKWMEDESGYDEKVWPRIKELIDKNRLSFRKRFDE